MSILLLEKIIFNCIIGFNKLELVIGYLKISVFLFPFSGYFTVFLSLFFKSSLQCSLASVRSGIFLLTLLEIKVYRLIQSTPSRISSVNVTKSAVSVSKVVSKAYLLIIIFNYRLFTIFHPHFFKTFFLYSIDASLYVAKKSLKLLWFKGNCKRTMCYSN